MARKIFLPTATALVETTRLATQSMYAWMRDITAGMTAGGGPAPADAEYVTYAANSTLTAERVATNSATVTVNLGTANQIKWDAVNTGDVVGPGSATDNAIARFDGTTGKLIQNSGITIADGASGTLSNTNTGDQNLFQTIAVSGQSNIVADSTADTLTVAAGSGITLTTDVSTDTLTITAAAGSGTLLGYDRLTGDGATTTFNLADVAEYVLDVSDAGLIVDPTLLTVSSDGSQVTFSVAPTAGHVLTFEYVVAQV